MKILICVPSDQEPRDYVSDLQDLGHICTLVDNSFSLMQSYIDNHPEMVILHYREKDLDVFATLQQLRSTCYDFSQWLPILIFADQYDDKLMYAAIDAGADDYICEPFSSSTIQAKMKVYQRIISLKQNMIDFSSQMQNVNDRLLSSTQTLSELSLQDPLTQIANRRAFQQSLDRSIREAIRHKTAVGLMMIDVDMFKKYNDHFGHQQGDKCLQKIASLLTSGLHRALDLVARYGGEEFVIVLPETSLEGLCNVAQRIRSLIYNANLDHPESPFKRVTVSIGVACAEPSVGFDAQLLIKTADQALYYAKERGRNTTVHCQELVNKLDPTKPLEFIKEAS